MTVKTVVRSLLLAVLAVWFAFGQNSIGAPPGPTSKKVSTDTLGGTERYLAYVSTDKPIYRAGEQVLVRAPLLHAKSHVPQPYGVSTMIEILGPKGEVVATGYSAAQQGVVGFAWTVPDTAAGGEYKVKLSFPNDGFPPAERKFDVRVYRPPRLKSQIVFARDGYGPGDQVTARLHTERAEGGLPAGAKVEVSARVDGAEVFRGRTAVDKSGDASTTFALPASIARGEGTLAFTIEDGGVVETATKTIPILLMTLDLAFYPEGGDLVAGLPTRVYIEARTPAQKPADLDGVIVDERDSEVAKLTTEHEGRGRVAFTPQAGRAYSLKIVRPSGILKTFPLPAVKPDGAVLAALDDITPAGKPVRLSVATSRPGKFTLTLSQRETELTAKTVEVAEPAFWRRGPKVGEANDISLDVPAGNDGTLIATLWDANGTPLAERLVFVAQEKPLQITVTPSKPSYPTGAPVELSIETRDADGKPVAATVGLTVTDESVLEMQEKREQAPQLVSMLYLENEVRELFDAAVYLDKTHPKYGLSTDLLLGTQGWRRFALVNSETFIAKHGDAARRVLALRLASVREEVLPVAAMAGGARPGAVRRGGMPNERPMAAPDRGAKVRMAPPPPAAPPRAAAGRVEPAKPQPRADAPAASATASRARLRDAMAAADEEVAEDRLFAAKAVAVPQAMVWTREYAHAARPDRQPGERVDFTETLYWSASTTTDQNGKATVRFALADSVTTLRILTDGFTQTGAIGSSKSSLQSIQPFYVEPKMPLQVSAGDEILLPVALVNATDKALTPLALTAKTDPSIGVQVPALSGTLGQNGRLRALATLSLKTFVGKTDVTVTAKAGSLSDQVTRPLDVRPLGFPFELAQGGMLEPGKNAAFTVDLPQTIVPQSIKATAFVYPTPLASMTQALERLIQEPYGCFEQTSSTTYPLVMAQQYFKSHSGVDSSLIERSRVLLQKGYDRLTTFECKQKGFEWFGEDPGHEALSAFGLMEFTDMARVHQVNGAMLSNTKAWLLGRRDGSGGFKHERRALHTWLVDNDLHNGYITWALLETGEQKIGREATAFVEAAQKSQDSYVVALGANVATLSGNAAARKLSERLVAKQTKDGWVDGAHTSIVGSRGESLQIETTALATLAWLRDPAFVAPAEKAIRWLASACEGGRFGSTQATVLALRAIVEYDRARSKPKAKGAVQLLVDGKPFGNPVDFGPDTHGVIALPDFGPSLKTGRHTIEMAMQKGAAMPYSLTVGYNAIEPASSPQTRLYLTTALKDRALTEGNVTEVNVMVGNLTDKPLPTPVAIIGVPGGLEVRHDQLKELKKSGKIAAYEVLGREVVLYWRELSARATVSLPISLVAAIPGSYTGPASRAYEYYADEFKIWTPALTVKITPRAAN